MTNPSNMWLSSEVFDWQLLPYSSEDLENDWGRAYEIWEHAEQILDKYDGEFHRVDVVTTLKRSMSHRLQLLKSLYNFDNIPVKDNPKRTIEQLAFWGIVRPTMLVRLIEIRNAVEHANEIPPDQDRCREFLDFIWYFLDSTDLLASDLCGGFSLELPSAVRYYLNIETGPNRKWAISGNGFFAKTMLSDTPKDNWLEIKVLEQENVEMLKSKPKKKDWDWEHQIRGMQDDDIHIQQCDIVGPPAQVENIFSIYFDVAVNSTRAFKR